MNDACRVASEGAVRGLACVDATWPPARVTLGLSRDIICDVLVGGVSGIPDRTAVLSWAATRRVSPVWLFLSSSLIA